MGEEKGAILQFAPFQTHADEGFWHRLSSLKLNKLGIDDSPIPFSGDKMFARSMNYAKNYEEKRRIYLKRSNVNNSNDGTIIRGQNEISHPTNGLMEPVKKEYSSIPALLSRIKRVFCMSREGTNSLHEVFPSANPAFLDLLKFVDCIVYAMGSLSTSICPSPVLLLNGSHDRETNGFTASCFVSAITEALNRTHGHPNNRLENLPSQYINILFVSKDGAIPVDMEKLASLGILNVVIVDSINEPEVGILYDHQSLIQSVADSIG